MSAAQRPLQIDKKGEFQQIDVMKQLLQAGFVNTSTMSSGDRHQSETAGRKTSTEVIVLNKDNQGGSRQETRGESNCNDPSLGSFIFAVSAKAINSLSLTSCKSVYSNVYEEPLNTVKSITFK